MDFLRVLWRFLLRKDVEESGLTRCEYDHPIPQTNMQPTLHIPVYTVGYIAITRNIQIMRRKRYK